MNFWRRRPVCQIRSALSERSRQHEFSETDLVLADGLILGAGDRVGREGLYPLLQVIAQLTRLPDQVVQKRLVLAAGALVCAVERARMQVGDAGNVAAELRNAILDGRDLDQRTNGFEYHP